MNPTIYATGSPSIQGYDVNALAMPAEDTDLGGLGTFAGDTGGVPSSDDTDLGSLGMQVPGSGGPAIPLAPHRVGGGAQHQLPGDMGALELRAQPDPVHQSHAQPGYPWDGHNPNQGPFNGPGGTSPMRAGDANVGAYAVAPPMPRALDGARYPGAAQGTYEQHNGAPSVVGAFAGVDEAALAHVPDLGGTKGRARRQARRNAPIDVRGSGGYVYRLFPDSSIVIVVTGDARALPVGARVTRASARWHAITTEVGTWEQARARQRATNAGTIAGGIAAVAGAVAPKKRPRRRRGGNTSDELPEDAGMVSAPQSSGYGWAPYVAAGAVGLALLYALASGGDGDKG